METWWLGFYVDPMKLALYLAFSIPLILALSYMTGLREDVKWAETIIDGATAYGVGTVTSAAVLWTLGVITVDMPAREIAGKIAIQAPTTALGAVIARSLLGGGGGQRDEEVRKQESGY